MCNLCYTSSPLLLISRPSSPASYFSFVPVATPASVVLGWRLASASSLVGLAARLTAWSLSFCLCSLRAASLFGLASHSPSITWLEALQLAPIYTSSESFSVVPCAVFGWITFREAARLETYRIFWDVAIFGIGFITTSATFPFLQASGLRGLTASCASFCAPQLAPFFTSLFRVPLARFSYGPCKKLQTHLTRAVDLWQAW